MCACSEEGHTSMECDKPLTEPLTTIVCRHCETTGHLAVDCPEKPKFMSHNFDAEGQGSR